MKVVIFAGGLGSRISEESHSKPKPMIEIGGKPILWHIMKIFEHYGFHEFIICLGYKGYLIKEYFSNYLYHHSDLTVDLLSNEIEIHKKTKDSFKVTLVDTGQETFTAGRLLRIKKYLDGEDEFMLTYGDGLANVDIKGLLEFHRSHKKTCTVTSIQPSGKFGVLKIADAGNVQAFTEKPSKGGSWINGGFFVLRKQIWEHLDEELDLVMWEEQPMKKLVELNELMAFQHHGFWKAMDTLRDKVELEKLWRTDPKWKVWQDE